MFQSPGDTAFTIANIDIHYYGIIMAFAMLSGTVVVCKIAKHYFKDISSDDVFDIAFLLILFGIVGARLYYVLLDYGYFIKYPQEIFAIRNGGLSVQGGIIAGIITGLIFAYRKKISFLRYADLFSFGVVTGQIIGRWGNFFNSEAFGLPTNLPWKLYIPYANRPFDYKGYEFFHPTFLYESLLSCIVFAILFFILKKYTDRKDGFIFFMYIILYSISRLIVETIRTDSVLNFGSIHIAHIMSVIFIITALICMYLLCIKKSSSEEK